LEEYFDESLMLFRYFLGLFVEELLYVSVKASLSHPDFESWHPIDKQLAIATISKTGDDKYYHAV
jgi:hypothetical protein